jgi:hypothetical protein
LYPPRIEDNGLFSSLEKSSSGNQAFSTGVEVNVSASGNVWRIQRSIIACSTVLITVVLTVGADLQEQLRLEVEQTPNDPARKIVGSPPVRSYVGMLRNTGKSPVLVQIIPISGRDSASGRFSTCYLERWNLNLRRWDYLPAAVMGIESVPVRTFTLKAGDAIRLCDASFPGEPESGACYRFTLQLQMKHATSPSVISRTFKVGTPAGKALPSGCLT